jgi:hypothetical protein
MLDLSSSKWAVSQPFVLETAQSGRSLIQCDESLIFSLDDDMSDWQGWFLKGDFDHNGLGAVNLTQLSTAVVDDFTDMILQSLNPNVAIPKIIVIRGDYGVAFSY